MSNHITITLCEEDRQRLDLIASLLMTGVEAMTAKKDAKPVEVPEQVNEHPVDEVSPHAAPEPAAEPEAVNYTKADVQALVMKLAAPGTGKKDAVKAIVNEYAKKISDIPAEKLNEVMAKLQKQAKEE